MSNAIMAECRALQMHPTAKAVLMALADRADDEGRSWPSIEKLVEDTCFRKTAVIESIKWLEASAILLANRSDGRHTTYQLDPKAFSPSAARTRTRRAPVRDADLASAPRVPDPSAARTQPVRGADTNHQEPKGTIKSNPQPRAKKTSADLKTALPNWLPRESWDEFIEHRKQIRKPMTALQAEKQIARLAKMHSQGLDVAGLIDHAIASGWQGIYVPRDGPANRKPSVADSFAGKAYTGTPENELPDFLRTDAA
jgi:hypothetical protein